MATKVALILFVFSLICIALNRIDSAPVDQCSFHNFEEKFAEVFNFQHKRRYPENDVEMKEFCEENLRVIPDIEQYDQMCLHVTIKNVVGKLLEGFRKESKLYCEKPDSKVTLEMLSIGNCLNANMAEWGKCMDTVARNFKLAKYAPQELRLPHVCCEFRQVPKCVFETIAEHGCADKNAPFKDLVNEYLDNFMSSICDEYKDDGTKCSQLPPLPNVEVNNKGTFLRNMIEMFETIKE